MDTGIGPVGGALDPSMFDRIIVDVLNMLLKVPLIPQAMLPTKMLPNILLLFIFTVGICNLGFIWQFFGKFGFDQTPAG